MQRDFDNVWWEICAKARQHQALEKPVLTLGTKVPHFVRDVTQDRIVTQADHPTSSKESILPRKHFEALWKALVEAGEANDNNVPQNVYYVSYAFLAQLIDGIGASSRPTTLFFEDRKAAFLPFVG